MPTVGILKERERVLSWQFHSKADRWVEVIQNMKGKKRQKAKDKNQLTLCANS